VGTAIFKILCSHQDEHILISRTKVTST
jgi:hypothetical protein